MIEFGRADEVQQDPEILLRLARKTHDQGSPQRHVGNRSTDPREQAEEAFSARSAPHRFQDRSARVLKRKVKVLAHLGRLRDRFD
jgi:hypothetical protein